MSLEGCGMMINIHDMRCMSLSAKLTKQHSKLVLKKKHTGKKSLWMPFRHCFFQIIH